MSDERPHEIIIIKRHSGGHEDGHHGGAWKIAYADFVTAMMAFFLVMWLLSANEKTKAAIVKYFNPIQLVDSTPQPPGMSDPTDKMPDPKKTGGAAMPEKDGKEAAATKGDAAATKDATPRHESKKDEGRRDDPKKEDERRDDAALFKDPYAVLGEIAKKDPAPAAQSAKAPNEAKPGAAAAAAAAAEGRGGEAFRDPFDPLAMRVHGSVDGTDDAAHPDPSASPADGEAAPPPVPALAPPAPAADLKARIEAAARGAGPGAAPSVEVRQTAEGLLVGLTDDARFSMFASASAEPTPRTVTLMEKIGRVLKAQKGRVVVRGYTDARQYRSGAYDNWRLSAARADMAHYMLVRGGVDDARFERIEGYADRQPRDARDPNAPENRRIEILVRAAL